jgi:hypothetical protein
MSLLNPKTAKNSAISRWLFGSLLILALILTVPCKMGVAQVPRAAKEGSTQPLPCGVPK